MEVTKAILESIELAKLSEDEITDISTAIESTQDSTEQKELIFTLVDRYSLSTTSENPEVDLVKSNQIIQKILSSSNIKKVLDEEAKNKAS